MEIWVSKDALTDGIQHFDEGAYLALGVASAGNHYFRREGRDWHRTRKAAVARAEKMRDDKIASLRKQIERLEKLTFE